MLNQDQIQEIARKQAQTKKNGASLHVMDSYIIKILIGQSF